MVHLHELTRYLKGNTPPNENLRCYTPLSWIAKIWRIQSSAIFPWLNPRWRVLRQREMAGRNKAGPGQCSASFIKGGMQKKGVEEDGSPLGAERNRFASCPNAGALQSSLTEGSCP